MDKNKRSNHAGARRKLSALLVSLAVLLIFTGTGTLAYLVVHTSELTNEFKPASVPIEVVETFKNNVKSDVCIMNDGDVSAYIRAAVIVSWVQQETPSNAYAVKPVEDIDYKIIWSSDGWLKDSDGFYYYSEPVKAGGKTAVLIAECKELPDSNCPEGCCLSVEILGQSIQADGISASGSRPVEEAWPSVKVVVDNKGTVNDTSDDTYSLELRLKRRQEYDQ